MLDGICLWVEKHSLAQTFGLHFGIGCQHTDVSPGLIALHMHTRNDSRLPETQDQNYRLFVK